MKAMILVALAVVLTCCQSLTPRHVVYVPDISGSISAQARADAVDAARYVSDELRRGDRLSIIPITSDAPFDAPRHTQRFSVPETPEPYDADLRELDEAIEVGLNKLVTVAAEKPFAHTDLFGTLRLAAEELAPGEPSLDSILICLSDFIADDTSYNFKRDARLATREEAIAFAQELAVTDVLPSFPGVRIFLGSVPSADLQQLSKKRQAAIRAFWIELLQLKGGTVTWASDGVGHVGRYLSTLPLRQPTSSLNADNDEAP